MNQQYNISIDIEKPKGKPYDVFIANDGSSSCQYDCESLAAVAECIKAYILNYLVDPSESESKETKEENNMEQFDIGGMGPFSVEKVIALLNRVEDDNNVTFKGSDISVCDQFKSTSCESRKKETLYIVQCEWSIHGSNDSDMGDEIFIATTDKVLAERCFNAWCNNLKNINYPRGWEVDEWSNNLSCYEGSGYIYNHIDLCLRTIDLIK